MQVVVRDNNIDQALKALKKKLQREGVFREMKLRRHYEKPSERRARESAEAVRRARKVERFLSQPFFVAEVFTGLKGEYVPVAETVESFEAIVNGDLDDMPEQAFLNVGGVEQVFAKSKALQEGAGT